MTAAVETQQRATSPPTRFRARLIAEAVGTGLLVVAVVGSGIAAQRLSDDTALQLLVNAIATGAVLTALIVVLQPVSAAFNPVVTLLERLTRTMGTGQALVTIAAQVVGGAVGAVLANLMFSETAVSIATTDRTGPGLWLGEVVATAGLVLTITALTRSGRPQHVAWAVGAYITAAYWFTSSTSFANPAVTLARMLSDTFAGINPASVPAFLACQIIGGASATSPPAPSTPTPRTSHDRQAIRSMGCGDTCPFYPGKRYEDRIVDDPAGQDLDHVRPIRDEIRRRVEDLIAGLVPGTGLSRQMIRARLPNGSS